jgi:hypothetical protein
VQLPRGRRWDYAFLGLEGEYRGTKSSDLEVESGVWEKGDVEARYQVIIDPIGPTCLFLAVHCQLINTDYQ